MRLYNITALLQVVAIVAGIAVFSVLLLVSTTSHSQIIDDAPAISNIQIVGVTATSALITWETNKKADALVNYGLDSSYGIARDPNFDETEHAIILKNLEPDTTYYFRTISEDTFKNRGISEGYSFRTKGSKTTSEEEGIRLVETDDQAIIAQQAVQLIDKLTDPDALQAVADELKIVIEDVLKAPSIIGDPVVEEGSDFAIIKWATDIPANSMVSFASEFEYNPALDFPYATTQGSPDELITSHKVRIIGLSPATTYHYRVSSKPDIGPTGVGEDKTFATKSTLPEIFGIDVLRVQDDSAMVVWSTNIPTNGLVRYTNMRTEDVKVAGDPTFLSRHTVQLSDLEFATRYSAVIIAENEMGDKVVSSPVTFRTVKDEIPPLISKVSNDSTLFPGEEIKIQTIVTWATDESSLCQFFFHQGIASGAEVESANPETGYTTEHVQVLTNFAPSTVYKFWIECEDKTANSSLSEDFVLFTPAKEKSIIDIIIENFEGTFGWVKKIGR